MRSDIDKILSKRKLKREDIIALLSTFSSQERYKVFAKAKQVKKKYVGKKVALRGLIEYSNKCRKNCLYCGIRLENRDVARYAIEKKDVLQAAKYAHENGFGSVVLQSGELCSQKHTAEISSLVKEIKEISDNKTGITLSCGEQTKKVYQDWFDKGAHRYLLRIESSNRKLFESIHPLDEMHCYDERIRCLKDLKSIGYQVGTGVMIGLPGQSIEDLADDILFFMQMDVDMVGMGPYLEHSETPLYKERAKLLPLNERFNLSLLMIAVLRIVMKDINIAASTALQAIDPCGREQGLHTGANVIMPNITPLKYREEYLLYNNKPGVNETAANYLKRLERNIADIGEEILYDEWGDSKHYKPDRF